MSPHMAASRLELMGIPAASCVPALSMPGSGGESAGRIQPPLRLTNVSTAPRQQQAEATRNSITATP